MASPGQQTVTRKYAYGYNGKTGYTRLLREAHRVLVTSMENKKDATGAEKIQHFLQNIKDTARILDESSNSKLNHDTNVAARWAQFTEEEKAWYTDFVNDLIATQTNKRQVKGLTELGGHFLKRTHQGFYEARDKELFDDIAEEELGYVFLEVQKKLSNDKFTIESTSMGTSGATIKGSEYFDQVGDSLYNHFVEAFQDRAKQCNQKYELGKQLKKEVRGKVDIQAGTYEINTVTNIKEEFFKEIIPYLNEATFTVKNYKTTTFEQFGLTLGHTNFYKAIVAELNVVFPNNPVNWQRDIFYRGAQILTKTNETPSASEEDVEKHFSHMRFVFELTGLGLIDKTGNPQFAKYLIYNDPTSSNIYVQDTASIILNEINKRKSGIRIFEGIHLKSIKGYKK